MFEKAQKILDGIQRDLWSTRVNVTAQDLEIEGILERLEALNSEFSSVLASDDERFRRIEDRVSRLEKFSAPVSLTACAHAAERGREAGRVEAAREIVNDARGNSSISVQMLADRIEREYLS